MSGFLQQPQQQAPQPDAQLMALLQAAMGIQAPAVDWSGTVKTPDGREVARPDAFAMGLGAPQGYQTNVMAGVGDAFASPARQAMLTDDNQVAWFDQMNMQQMLAQQQAQLMDWWANNFPKQIQSTAGPGVPDMKMPNPAKQTSVFKQMNPAETYIKQPLPQTRILGGSNGAMNPWSPTQKNPFNPYGK